jgi:hypothetical protein
MKHLLKRGMLFRPQAAETLQQVKAGALRNRQMIVQTVKRMF